MIAADASRRFSWRGEDWEFRPEDIAEHGERAQVSAFEGDRVVRCDFHPDRDAASDAL